MGQFTTLGGEDFLQRHCKLATPVWAICASISDSRGRQWGCQNKKWIPG